MQWASYYREVQRLHKRFAIVALRAAAITVRNEAKRNVRGGFSSGKYVTGRLFNSIEYVIDYSMFEAKVGTVVNYGAFWELGHWNPFVRKYLRYRWLAPAFVQTTREQQKNVVTAIRREASQSTLAGALGAALISSSGLEGSGPRRTVGDYQ